MGPPGEDNSNARMKHRISGRNVAAAITDGQLTFGIRERIFQGEFDGWRRKRVLVKVIGE